MLAEARKSFTTYYQAPIIAPMAKQETNDAQSSKYHNLGERPIQITSIEVVVKTKPSHTQNAQTMPFKVPLPPMTGEVTAKR